VSTVNDKAFELHTEQDAKEFAAINKKLDVLLEAHAKQRGFIAGFSAAFSLLVSTVVALVVYIWNQR
jgi:hypothetical protein